MIKIGAGIFVLLVLVMLISLAKSAGMADRRLEEMQRFTAGREAGVQSGD